MSSIDLKKLNNLLLPPLRSTITGNDCFAPFGSGYIELVAGDKFVGVEGNVNVQNVDEFGEVVKTLTPYEIHKNLYLLVQ
jgi:hypothetical protein